MTPQRECSEDNACSCIRFSGIPRLVHRFPESSDSLLKRCSCESGCAVVLTVWFRTAMKEEDTNIITRMLKFLLWRLRDFAKEFSKR